MEGDTPEIFAMRFQLTCLVYVTLAAGQCAEPVLSWRSQAQRSTYTMLYAVAIIAE